MTVAAARSAEERKRDTLARLEGDIDLWVASAGERGEPYLIPLSFVWVDGTVVITTPEASPTSRNLRASGKVRLALGGTRDVVLIEGVVEAFSREAVPAVLADPFAARHWDARLDTPPYAFFQVTPRRVQAWREANELAGRELMRDGRWLV